MNKTRPVEDYCVTQCIVFVSVQDPHYRARTTEMIH